jgi:hypothetical protein
LLGGIVHVEELSGEDDRPGGPGLYRMNCWQG